MGLSRHERLARGFLGTGKPDSRAPHAASSTVRDMCSTLSGGAPLLLIDPDRRPNHLCRRASWSRASAERDEPCCARELSQLAPRNRRKQAGPGHE